MQCLELDFHKLEYFSSNCKKSISQVQNTIFISAGSLFHTLFTVHYDISSIHHFYDYKVIGQPKV